VPERRVCIDIYSSRLSKAFIFLSKGFRKVKELYSLKSSVKPLLLTPLRPVNGGRFILGGESTCFEAGSNLYFSVSLASGDPGVLEDLAVDEVVQPEGWPTRFRIYTERVEFAKVDDLSIGFTDPEKQAVKIVFRTPTLLPSKLMAPPLDSFRKRLGEKNLYILYPSIGHICCYLAKLYHSSTGVTLMGGPTPEWAAYFSGRLCEAAAATLDLRIVPRTVRYDEKRSVRGFTGWALYVFNLRRSRAVKIVDRLLALAARLGVGKSRSIGFGVVDVNVVPINTD